MVGQSLHFNEGGGSGDYIYTGKIGDGSGDFTSMCWVKLDTFSKRVNIFGGGGFLNIAYNNDTFFCSNTGSNYAAFGFDNVSSTYNTGEWVHLCGVWVKVEKK